MKQASLRYGLIAGVGVVAYFLFFYAIQDALVLNPYVWWASLVLYLWAMQQAAKKEGEKDAFLSFLKPAFTVFVIANAFFYCFYYFLFGVFDPSLVDLQREMLAANPRAPENLADIDLAVTPTRIFFGYCSSLIGGFALAIGIAFLARQSA